MKRMIKYIGLLFFSGILFLACQQESMEIADPVFSFDLPEKATIELVPVLDADVVQGSEVIPMTRAKNDTIFTLLVKTYQVIIIKRADKKWVIDTLITGKLEGGGKYDRKINVYATTSLPVIKLALRPGTYKAVFFLNANDQNWNPDIKPGFVVSEEEEINPKDDLPYAYTYLIQKSDLFMNYNRIMLNDEPFVGSTSFTIQKNDTLQQTGVIPRQKLTLERRAARFRYLLKQTEVEVSKDYYMRFEDTEHYLRAEFKVSKENPFCQGLNILGGGYYPRDSVLSSVMLYVSASRMFTSPVDHQTYHITTPANVTYSSYYILMDRKYPDGIDCEITNILITAQNRQPIFAYKGSISRRLRRNQISGVVFELTPEIKEVNDGIPTFYIKEDTDADAVRLFNPYFELNPNL